MNTTATPAPLVQIDVAAPSAGTAAYARQEVAAALTHAPAPVLHARVRVVRHRDPAMDRPVVATATVQLPGCFVRAEAAGAGNHEAVAALRQRLSAQLTHSVRRTRGSWEDRRPRLATGAPHEWHHGDQAPSRPPFVVLPADEREVVRHASISPETCSVDEAAADLEAMDHRFRLFTELGSGQDSVLARDGAEWVLAQADPAADRLAAHQLACTVRPHRAPRLPVSEAIIQLDLRGDPYLFFVDTDTARGAVLYHRYDGHLGLVSAQ